MIEATNDPPLLYGLTTLGIAWNAPVNNAVERCVLIDLATSCPQRDRHVPVHWADLYHMIGGDDGDGQGAIALALVWLVQRDYISIKYETGRAMIIPDWYQIAESAALHKERHGH